MPIELPMPVADYVAANACLDVGGMLAPFAADAVILDMDKRFEGKGAIRDLIEKAVLPVQAVFTPDTVRYEQNRVVVEGPTYGDFKGCPIRFTYGFTLENGAIKTLVITL